MTLNPEALRSALKDVEADSQEFGAPEPELALVLEAARAYLSAMAAPDEVEAAAKAIWEAADDEVGWEGSVGLAKTGDTYITQQVEWVRDQARAALAAARVRSAVGAVGPKIEWRDIGGEGVVAMIVGDTFGEIQKARDGYRWTFRINDGELLARGVEASLKAAETACENMIRDWFVRAGWSAAPAQAQSVVPAGWKLVPVEPDDSMIEAGEDVIEQNMGMQVYAAEVFEAMARAAPQPDPAQAQTPSTYWTGGAEAMRSAAAKVATDAWQTAPDTAIASQMWSEAGDEIARAINALPLSTQPGQPGAQSDEESNRG